MDKIERTRAVLDGRIPDRVPVFCAGIEDRTYNEVLGKPLIPPKYLLINPVTGFIFNRWGPELTRKLVQPSITAGMEKRVRAAAELGFDATWALYDETFTVTGANTMARYSGSLYDIVDDGFGNATYMYREPGITTRDDFESWPFWPDIDDLAHRTYKFYRKIVKKYGDRIFLFGQGPAYGIQESLLWAIGFERMTLWIRREADLVKRYIEMSEEICLKCAIAMMDAGISAVLQTDDFAFKSGPLMNPKMIDEVFGPSYKRIIETVKNRDGKYILHSCGDNTLLFDTFINWGVDGFHAYENTSNVDIYSQKKLHGDRAVMIGGVDIDYTLTDQASDMDIENAVKDLMDGLAPGGRYIIGPAHSLASIPAHNLRVMIEAAHTHGAYTDA